MNNISKYTNIHADIENKYINEIKKDEETFGKVPQNNKK